MAKAHRSLELYLENLPFFRQKLTLWMARKSKTRFRRPGVFSIVVADREFGI